MFPAESGTAYYIYPENLQTSDMTQEKAFSVLKEKGYEVKNTTILHYIESKNSTIEVKSILIKDNSFEIYLYRYNGNWTVFCEGGYIQNSINPWDNNEESDISAAKRELVDVMKTIGLFNSNTQLKVSYCDHPSEVLICIPYGIIFFSALIFGIFYIDKFFVKFKRKQTLLKEIKEKEVEKQKN
jgi:hypothetical protein